MNIENVLTNNSDGAEKLSTQVSPGDYLEIGWRGFTFNFLQLEFRCEIGLKYDSLLMPLTLPAFLWVATSLVIKKLRHSSPANCCRRQLPQLKERFIFPMNIRIFGMSIDWS